MKNRILFVALMLSILLMIAAVPVSAASDISVVLDGKTMAFDVPPQLMNDRTMVPLSAIFEAMGAKVDWNGDTQTVTGTKDSTVVVLVIGSTSPTINGNVVTIDQPGVIIEGRTLAPLRFVAEAFGGDVAWDGNTQTASITMGGTAPTMPPATAVPTPEPLTTPTPAQPQGGAIDSKLIGRWQHTGTNTNNQNFVYTYFFYENGSFQYFRNIGAATGGADGKYRCSGGKIYFSELNDINAIEERTPYADIVFEYEFGNDEIGEYLLICHFNYLGENRDINSGIKFRKQ